MAIRTPKWLPKGARPTTIGWISSKGEVLKRQKISAIDIAEWHGETSSVQMLTEAPSVQSPVEQETINHFYAASSNLLSDDGESADDDGEEINQW